MRVTGGGISRVVVPAAGRTATRSLPYRPAAAAGWPAAFAVLSIGPFMGTLAMLRLRGDPAARKLASGRR